MPGAPSLTFCVKGGIARTFPLGIFVTELVLPNPMRSFSVALGT
jgi:hypothetical protein